MDDITFQQDFVNPNEELGTAKAVGDPSFVAPPPPDVDVPMPEEAPRAPSLVPQKIRAMDPAERSLWNLWKKATPSAQGMRYAERTVARIKENLAVYQRISDALGNGMPAWFIGCLHSRENDSLSLEAYIGNGQKIIGTGRKTTIVPRNRGPFATFEQGALDAFRLDRFDRIKTWDLAICLDYAERWNGLGYRRLGVISPYLWSMTNIYHAGKYTSDGHYDRNAVDQELGFAVVLRALKDAGFDLNEVAPA